MLLTFVSLWLTRMQMTSNSARSDKWNQRGQKAARWQHRGGLTDCKPCCQSIRFSLLARQRLSIPPPNNRWRTCALCVCVFGCSHTHALNVQIHFKMHLFLYTEPRFYTLVWRCRWEKSNKLVYACVRWCQFPIFVCEFGQKSQQ